MNKELTLAIVKHIFANLGLFGETTSSLFQKDFVINKSIEYYTEDFEGNQIEKQSEIFSCKSQVGLNKINMIATSMEDEHFVIVKLEKSPTYGVFFSSEEETGMIAFQTKEGNFSEASIFLQSSFLAGMEQLKDISTKYERENNNDELIASLKSFIAFEAMLSVEN